MSTSNARAHPRFALEVDADVRFGDQRIPVRTRDLSRGGLCFVADRPIPLGQEVALTMALVFDESTFSEPLRIRARALWCTPLGEGRHQVGVTFLAMTAEDRAFLDLFLRYLKEGLARLQGGSE